jgi:S1-C subfamily serine protease
MINEMRNIDLFDDYLSDNLSDNEKLSFETKLKENIEFKKEFDSHKNFVLLMQENARNEDFKHKLKSIHINEFGKNNIQSINQRPKNYFQIAMIAASVALITVISTLLLFNYSGIGLKKQNTDYTELKREVSAIKNSQNELIKDIRKNSKKRAVAPANFTGTGFILNDKGYFITSLHLVKGCDSVFIENSIFDRISARIVYSDTKLDIAILKLDSLIAIDNLPYGFKTKESDLGENIFTLGYPSQDIVYGEGSISSSTRFGDTMMYQISIPVNPGNSGGPLLDENGNIIGVVSGKNQNAEGTGFASKSMYINDIINELNDDELKKELKLSKRNNLKGLKRSEQIKKISPFIFNVYVYKGN